MQKPIQRTIALFAIAIITGLLGTRSFLARTINASPRLDYVMLDCSSVKIGYSKPFPECVHLVTDDEEDSLHGAGILCTGHEKIIPRRLFRAELEDGLAVKLCNQNDYRLCSEETIVHEKQCPEPLVFDDESGAFWHNGNFSPFLDERAFGGLLHVAAVGYYGTWDLGKLKPGTYEILLTWIPDRENTSGAQYEIRNSAYRVFGRFRFDQRFDPAGEEFRGVLWEKGATITLREAERILVSVRPGNGMTIADALMLRRVH